MTTTTDIRVRFAPSPTGFFHVGGARTALYNWLVAQQRQGSFILRIEDTDRERSDEGWTDGIVSALGWLGITWDEGPYRQSERQEHYRAAVDRLTEAGMLYACDCTREALQARRASGASSGYDAYCRDRHLDLGPGRALRFRVPLSGTTTVHDLVRGDVEFANDTIEDFVVVKSNGDPLFVLAVVVDDIEMRISHIIRAEEHLPTTPKAILLWKALSEAPLPQFAHLPVIVNERRQKLSKRRDRVAIEDYRALGYLPEAMRNYLCLLGWSPDDGREILSVQEMIEEFDLSKVNNSPAFFDERRLDHFNGLYIRSLSDEAFLERALPFVEGDYATWPPARFDRKVFESLAPLIKERINRLSEVADYVHFLFDRPFEPEEAAFSKVIVHDEVAPKLLSDARAAFSTGAYSSESLKAMMTEIGERYQKKLAKAQAPIRVATMGATVGLPLFESLVALGREEVLGRIDSALERLAGQS